MEKKYVDELLAVRRGASERIGYPAGLMSAFESPNNKLLSVVCRIVVPEAGVNADRRSSRRRGPPSYCWQRW